MRTHTPDLRHGHRVSFFSSNEWRENRPNACQMVKHGRLPSILDQFRRRCQGWVLSLSGGILDDEDEFEAVNLNDYSARFANCAPVKVGCSYCTAECNYG